jgi:hypothetical protein
MPRLPVWHQLAGPTAAGGHRVGADASVGHATQARALVCGPEGAGQGHLAPALLAALEALPVHAIGLPNLLSDANSRCSLPANIMFQTQFIVDDCATYPALQCTMMRCACAA